MNNIKKLLKHELLNVITLINFSLLEPRKHQVELQELLKKAALLIKHEGVFLGEKEELSQRACPLESMLETIVLSNKKKQRKNKVKVRLPKTSWEVLSDRYYLEDALGQIHQTLLDHAKQISYLYDPETSSLIIDHDAGPLDTKNKASLKIALEKKKQDRFDICFRLALELFKQLNCQLQEQAGRLSISFPKN